MGRLVVLVTSPRVPAGLLSRPAWSAIDEASLVATAALDDPVAVAIGTTGTTVIVEQPVASRLLSLAARQTVVWLASDDGDGDLLDELAEAVVKRTADGAADEVEIEVIVGSYDPAGARIVDLVEVMDRLRRDCPWDRKQTHESLVRYLVEETYETIDAIESGDADHLREELGDLLLQVVFHARLAEEDADSPFGLDDVAAGIVDKLIRRHPHVFGDVDADDAETVERNWEALKSIEKAERAEQARATEGTRTRASSPLDDVPRGLPALSLASKIIDRSLAASRPLSVPYPESTTASAESVGDVLFAIVAGAHAAGIDAEQALRARCLAEIDREHGLGSQT